jgi:hypothetical protein
MATLRQALESHFSHPDSELSASSLAAKRNFGIDALFAELRDMRSVRRAPLMPVKPVRSIVPVLSVDEANRRTVEALGRRIAAEARRDELRRRLYPTSEELEQEREAKRHRENLAAAQRLGRELLYGE